MISIITAIREQEEMVLVVVWMAPSELAGSSQRP
jgi:hypothetical protein